MSKCVRFVVLPILVIAAIAGAVGLYVYRATQLEPAFYQQAMRAPLERQAQAGEELEQNVLELRNGVRVPGRWEAVFTDEQINGWLAIDLPEKFPGTLPEGVEDPRVAIHDGQVHIAARYRDKIVASIVSIALDVRLTEQDNTIAVTIKHVRAGALPVPVRQFLDRISEVAARSPVTLRWSLADGNPVALVTIPSQHRDYMLQEVFVETIEFRDGEVYLAGRTSKTRPASATVAQNVTGDQPERNVKVQR